MIHCSFYLSSCKSDFFFQMQRGVWQSLCQEKPQCLRFSRLSVAFRDLLWSPEVWPVKIRLTCSGLQPYQTNHLIWAFSSVLWHFMSSLSREVAPLVSLWALLSVSVWTTFICPSDLQLDVTPLTRADLLRLLYLCGRSYNVSWQLLQAPPGFVTLYKYSSWTCFSHQSEYELIES